MTRIRVWLLEPDFSPVTSGGLPVELTRSKERKWQNAISDTGMASLNLANSDPLTPLCTPRRLLRLDLDGAPQFVGEIQPRTIHTVHPSEEVGQVTEIAVVGTLVRWAQMVVYPATPLGWRPWGDDRFFNFASLDLDDSGWAAAVATPDDSTVTGAPNVYADMVGWPDRTAKWIWDRDNHGAYDPLNPTNPASPLSPAGDVYFRKGFTMADEALVEVHAGADDAYELWLDGVPLFSDGPIYRGQSKHEAHVLSAGDHLLAVRGTNSNALKAGLRVTVMTVAPDNTLDTVVVNTDATWAVLGYPAEPPGFTPGEILGILRDEYVARGGSNIALGFTDSHDSAAVPWPSAPDVAFKVGLDGLSAIRQLAATYADVLMRNDSLTLDAYVYGTLGGASGVSFTPAVNIAELTHELS